MDFNLYKENGFSNRDEYLKSLADDYGMSYGDVKAVADVLGPDEDFDALITELEDMLYRKETESEEDESDFDEDEFKKTFHISYGPGEMIVVFNQPEAVHKYTDDKEEMKSVVKKALDDGMFVSVENINDDTYYEFDSSFYDGETIRSAYVNPDGLKVKDIEDHFKSMFESVENNELPKKMKKYNFVCESCGTKTESDNGKFISDKNGAKRINKVVCPECGKRCKFVDDAEETVTEEFNITDEMKSDLSNFYKSTVDRLMKYSTDALELVKEMKKIFHELGGGTSCYTESPTYIVSQGWIPYDDGKHYTMWNSISLKSYTEGDINRFAEDLTMAYAHQKYGDIKTNTPDLMKSLKEEYISEKINLVSAEGQILKDMEEVFSKHGFTIDEDGDDGWNPASHWWQIRKAGTNITSQEQFDDAVEKFVKPLTSDINKIETKYNSPITWNFGCSINGDITAGVDARPMSTDDGE